MGFEDLAENTEWECKRVAAAYGLETFEQKRFRSAIYDVPILEGKSRLGDALIAWHIDGRDGSLHALRIYRDDEAGVCEESFLGLTTLSGRASRSVTQCATNPSINELMARGLYCLGLEDLLLQLNYPLTAHEKIELRLSLPREFWPQKWIEEEQ